MFSWYAGTLQWGHQQNHFTITYFEDRPGQVQYKYYDVVQDPGPSAYAQVVISKSCHHGFIKDIELINIQMALQLPLSQAASTSHPASKSASQHQTILMSPSRVRLMIAQAVAASATGTHVQSFSHPRDLEVSGLND